MEAVGKPLLPWAVQRGVATAPRRRWDWSRYRTVCDDGAYPSSDRCAAHFVRGIFRHIGFALNRKSKNHKF